MLNTVRCKKLQPFSNKYSFLNHLSVQALSKLAYSFQILSYKNGNYVFKQGDKAEGIYLIMEGDFEILIASDLHWNIAKLDSKSWAPKKLETTRVVIMTTGDSFGLHECFNKPYERSYTVKCTSSHGRLYYLSMISFIFWNLL